VLTDKLFLLTIALIWFEKEFNSLTKLIKFWLSLNLSKFIFYFTLIRFDFSVLCIFSDSSSFEQERIKYTDSKITAKLKNKFFI
jgi:hypothetical protein